MTHRIASRPSPTAAHTPLPVYWTRPGKFRGCRISTLPGWYLARIEFHPAASMLERAVVRAEMGFRTMAGDSWRGF